MNQLIQVKHLHWYFFLQCLFLIIAIGYIPTSILTIQNLVYGPSDVLILNLPRFQLLASGIQRITGAVSGDSRILVGPNGVALSPYTSIKESHCIAYAVRAILSYPDLPYITDDSVSVIIPARDEDDYIARTIQFTLQNTPKEILKEIIIVDDASAKPLKQIIEEKLSPHELEKIRVFRFDTKEGLIRARIKGADEAKASNILFLDGHCRPRKNWVEPLLDHLKINYKRIVSPVIEDVHPITWDFVGTHGTKMMFDWIFEFKWYEDLTDEVPLSPGGIIILTKKYWNEEGKYDPDMLEWGGENFEMSFRTWMCGGDIFFDSTSWIGHIFSRPPKPNPGNSLIRQIQINQKRAALVWLDNYYVYFNETHVEARPLNPGANLETRYELRKKNKCMNFQWYVDKFRSSFDRKLMLYKEDIMIEHIASHLCLTATNSKEVVLTQCNVESMNQHWQAAAGNRFIINSELSLCLSITKRAELSMAECDWKELFGGSTDQFFQFDSMTTKRIGTTTKKSVNTLTGNDKLYPREIFMDSKYASSCLTAKLAFWDVLDPSIAYKVHLEPCLPHTDIVDYMYWRDPGAFQMYPFTDVGEMLIED